MNGIPNVENEIFSTCTDTLQEFDPDIETISSPEDIPEKIPCVSIYEINNIPYERGRVTENPETHSYLEYQIDIYTNDVNGKKARAQGYRDVISIFFQDMGFVRTVCTPIPNYTNPAVYRITMRFSAIMDKTKTTHNRR